MVGVDIVVLFGFVGCDGGVVWVVIYVWCCSWCDGCWGCWGEFCCDGWWDDCCWWWLLIVVLFSGGELLLLIDFGWIDEMEVRFVWRVERVLFGFVVLVMFG